MSLSIDSFGCLSNTIKVSAGHYVDLLNPDPETIEIRSIAAALSKICRFGGHCPYFYSVAEHCIHAVDLARSEGYAGEPLIAILLHDATEAYLGDMVKPLKMNMPQYVELEQRMESAISLAFGIDFDRWKPLIKRFDRGMLKAEKMRLWPEDKEHWAGFSDIEDTKVHFHFCTPTIAEITFLKVALNLGMKVNTQE
jgi:uncharacterized protein